MRLIRNKYVGAAGAFCLIAFCLVVCGKPGHISKVAVAQSAGEPWQSAITGLWDSEFQKMGGNKVQPGTNKNVLDENSFVLTTDKDQLDTQLRRTRALLANLKAQKHAPNFTALEKQVNEIAAKGEEARKANDGNKIKDLYMSLRAVMRQISFANPLLKFDNMLLMGYIRPGGDYHMVDQYVGWNARAGGGLFIIHDFKTAPSVSNVLDKSIVKNGRFKDKSLLGGAFLRPDLSFDGKKIVFAWNNVEDQCYHIFSVNVDGSDLRQLTDGTPNRGQLGVANTGHNDFDPCWLPSGRIAFLSDRTGGYGRCHGRPLLAYTLQSMNSNGSDIITLSYHETNEWNPSVDRDGKIVYTRWDYIDRDDCIAHHLWTCYPDGRDPRAPHGNYPLPLGFEEKDRTDGRIFRPNGEWNIRAVPNSNKYTATAAGHHVHSFGQLVMIDTTIPDDGKMSQVKGITTGQDRWPDADGEYGTCWPLSEDYYLCSYRGDIILLDRFGNKELICPKSAIPVNVDRVIHPIPLTARPKPPVIPTATYQGERASKKAPKATISVMNVYEGDMQLPKEIKVKWLRVIQIIPQLTPNADQPKVGYATESLARMPLGVVPVEADGSVHFKAPVERLLYFQLLNEKGLAVRSMRSVTYAHPGEKLNCVGCHEPRNSSPKSKQTVPIALRRAPSNIAPEVSQGAMPYSFARLVKPVFDAKCASCHREKGKGPDMSYPSLDSYVFHMPFKHTAACNGEIVDSGSRTVPGKFGAMQSALLKFLDKSHYDVNLTPDEYRRITLWIDCNANELGTYTRLDEQRRGEIVWPEIGVDPKNPLGIE